MMHANMVFYLNKNLLKYIKYNIFIKTNFNLYQKYTLKNYLKCFLLYLYVNISNVNHIRNKTSKE